MNIFLDKSLPKRTQKILQVIRVVLLATLFGGIFYASINPLAGDILLYSSLAFAIIFFAVKFLFERRRKNLVSRGEPIALQEVQGSDTTKMS
jgi:hypothetical protein